MPEGGFNSLIRRLARRLNLSARLEHALTKTLTLRGEYQRNASRQSNLGAGDFDLPERAYSLNSVEHLLRVAGSDTLSKRLVNEFRFQGRWQETGSWTISDQAAVVDGKFGAGVVRGGVGWLIAYWVTPLLAALNPIQTLTFSAFLRDIRLDLRALAFTSLISLVTALVAGLLPARTAARGADLMTVMKQREQRSGGASAGRRLLGALVVGELALAVTLLAGGGLLIQSFQRLQRIDLGFRPDNLLTLQTTLSSTKYPVPLCGRSLAQSHSAV